MDELTYSPESEVDDDDLRPVPIERRTFSWSDMAGLWAGMVINVPSYYIAGGLVDLGMSWWQGIITIAAGHAIILGPLILTGVPGTQYGIPFPVQLRAAFGVRGAHIPALLRALVACGWCGIETWIGGQAIYLLLPSSVTRPSGFTQPLPWLGTSILEFSCFIVFMVVQLALLWKGMAGVRALERYSAPVLILLLGCLFCWAYAKAGGFGEMLSSPSRLSPSQFWAVFAPSLTANIANWAGVALNISDFTRHAKSQKDQIFGQLGFPILTASYAFVGLAITSATPAIFGRVISSPVELLREIGGTFTTVLAIIGISLATVTTNIPCNFVAPANVLLSMSPSTFSFTGGVLLTSAVSIVIQPWRILGSTESFIYTWLGGYSSILASISAIIVTDYYILRRMELDVGGLYSVKPHGPYYYYGGYNVVAMVALIASVGPTVPGFLHKTGIVKETSEAFVVIYENAWFFGFFSAAIVYWTLSCCLRRTRQAPADPSMLDPLKPAGVDMVS